MASRETFRLIGQEFSESRREIRSYCRRAPHTADSAIIYTSSSTSDEQTAEINDIERKLTAQNGAGKSLSPLKKRDSNSVIGALGRMLSTGALADVTLSASGTSIKAHKLVLASCSQYFAQLFKEVEADNHTLVVVLGCDAAELQLLLTFMYTGEVTASKRVLPSLLRLAQTLKVSGLTDAETNSTVNPTESETQEDHPASPINLELNNTATEKSVISNDNSCSSYKHDEFISPIDTKEPFCISEFNARNEKDKLSKLDQIVQNLYSTHKIVNPTAGPPLAPNILTPIPSLGDPEPYDRKYRVNSSVCTICNKRLSNQYNLRVHMETHAGRRHACRACSHVSRSRDALRKHVAYRHARTDVGRADF